MVWGLFSHIHRGAQSLLNWGCAKGLFGKGALVTTAAQKPKVSVDLLLQAPCEPLHASSISCGDVIALSLCMQKQYKPWTDAENEKLRTAIDKELEETYGSSDKRGDKRRAISIDALAERVGRTKEAVRRHVMALKLDVKFGTVPRCPQPAPVSFILHFF